MPFFSLISDETSGTGTSVSEQSGEEAKDESKKEQVANNQNTDSSFKQSDAKTIFIRSGSEPKEHSDSDETPPMPASQTHYASSSQEF